MLLPQLLHRALMRALPCCVLLFACPLLAQTPVPPGGVSALTGDPIDTFALNGGSRQIVDVSGQPFTRAARITVTGTPEYFYNVQYGGPLNRAVVAGELALLRFYARTIEGTGETNEGVVTVFSQRNIDPWDKAITAEYRAGAGWTEFLVPYLFTTSHPLGQHSIMFGFGAHGAQILEIGGVELIYYGSLYTLDDMPRTERTYQGQEDDAPWRAEALARIDTIRKGPLSVQVVGTDGAPVPGAAVVVELERHGFPFGTVIYADRIVGTGTVNETYRKKLLELFSAAGTENDLKWPPWEGDWGSSFSQQQTIDALKWLKDHFVYVRGHVLVWPGWDNLPKSINTLHQNGNDAAIPAATLAHIDAITQATKGLVDGWDVLNEPFANHDLMDLFGDSIMIDWFQRARMNLPDTELFLNDYSIVSSGGSWTAKQNAFINTAQYLIDNDSGITGLGLQCHFGTSPTDPVKVLEVLDLIADLGLPIHVTEFDMATTETKLQADYTRDFYIAAFSHPAVELIQMWGFWAGQHWEPDAAMYEVDWTEKPNGTAYRKLMEETFHTRIATSAGAAGMVEDRGFFGDYLVLATANGQIGLARFSLQADGGVVQVHLEDSPLVRVYEDGSDYAELIYPSDVAAPAVVWQSNNLSTWAVASATPEVLAEVDGVQILRVQVRMRTGLPYYFRVQ